MRKLIGQFIEKDIINRIQNKFFIRIGVFESIDLRPNVSNRELDKRYVKREVNLKDSRLLQEYATKHRSKRHFEKNIFPRLTDNKRFKGFAIIDIVENEIAYLCWMDFRYLAIPENGFSVKLNLNEVYFFDDHCVSAHQRKGLHGTMFNERLLYCKRNELTKILIVIYLNNSRALKNLKKYNFNLVRIFLYFPWIKKVEINNGN